MIERTRTTRLIRHSVALICALYVATTTTTVVAQNKLVSKDTARKAITRIAGLELKKGDVKVTEVSGAGATPEVAATIKTAFRLRQAADGQWQAVEVRVGDRQWEEIELLAHAAHAERTTPLVAQLEALTAQLAERERAKAEAKKRQKEGEKAGTPGLDKQSKQKKKQPAASSPAADDLRAGPFRVKNFAALLSSATVETELAATFRLNKDARGQWQVTEARIGDSSWQNVALLVAALNTEKVARARADLAALAAALDAFRRARGFYVVADTSAALVDQLNPRYTTSIIRLDPWHRPYEYTGTTDSFTLRSLGPDGKPNTADDVTRDNAER
ncbi:MAG TPA: type II secretion system protein GspG [Pyrinomonadaceae bacterium]|jgi:hypothetical protein